MIKTKFFYRIYKAKNSKPIYYLGTAFPIAKSGILMTCRHVVEVNLDKDEYLAVFDEAKNLLVPIEDIRYPSDARVDIAILVGVPNSTKKEFIPFLDPRKLQVGEDVYTMGFFSEHENNVLTQDAYFGGKIVNFRNAMNSNHAALTLPFAIIEGMSGSPILTYHNGVKVVGMAIGSKSARVIASEVTEYKDEILTMKETVNRIIEFGIAYHAVTLIDILKELKIPLTVTDQAFDIDKL